MSSLAIGLIAGAVVLFLLFMWLATRERVTSPGVTVGEWQNR